MIAFACPMSDAAGHPAGLVLNCAAVHAFCSVVSREGSCLGRSTLTSSDVRLGPRGAVGYGELRGEARAVGFAGFAGGRDRELRLELEAGAVSGLKRRADRDRDLRRRGW